MRRYDSILILVLSRLFYNSIDFSFPFYFSNRWFFLFLLYHFSISISGVRASHDFFFFFLLDRDRKSRMKRDDEMK
jgi:hypothetical protein